MLVTAVLDPSALEQENYKGDTDYQTQTRLLFLGILENGLLLVDQQGLLLEKIACSVKKLPPKIQQSTQILFEEIRKNKHIIECDLSGSLKADSLEVCFAIQRELSPDAIILSPRNFSNLLASNPKCPIEVFSLSNYIDSKFETLRRDYSNGSPFFSGISLDECRKLFNRLTRYTRRLHLWDKQLSRCYKAKDAARFYSGIEFILEGWDKNGFFDKKTLTVWTFNNNDRSGRQKSHRICETEIFDKLAAKYKKENGWEINCHFCEDRKNQWHARYMQTDAAVLLLERGFDFIGQKGKLKATSLVFLKRANEELENFKKEASRSCT